LFSGEGNEKENLKQNFNMPKHQSFMAFLILRKGIENIKHYFFGFRFVLDVSAVREKRNFSGKPETFPPKSNLAFRNNFSQTQLVH